MAAQATEPEAEVRVFALNQTITDQQMPQEAARLVAVFREPGEKIFLQTLPDGPDELYFRSAWTDQSGQRRETQKYRLATADGGHLEDCTARGGSFTLAQIEAGQYLRANHARLGVAWVVNVLSAEATRRQSDQVSRVAAVYIDLDGKPLPPTFPHQPTAIVETSPGRFHVYWKVTDLPLEEFRTVQKFLATLYGADTSVCDLPRTMRLPGYVHGKNEPGFLTRTVELHADVQHSRAELLVGWPELQDALNAAKADREQQLKATRRRRADIQKRQNEIEAGTLVGSNPACVKYVQVLLDGCCADLLAAPLGKRNSTLNAVAYRAGRAIGTGFLDEAEVRASLSAVAAQIGLGKAETSVTLDSGLQAGKADPLDLSAVGSRARKASKKTTVTINVTAVEGLPAAEDLPDPQGENDTYSAGQLLDLLGVRVRWNVVAIDRDLAHSRRLCDHAGNDLAFVPDLGGYLAWNGKQWLGGGKSGPGRLEARQRVQELGKAMEWETDRLLNLYSVLDTATRRLSSSLDADPRKVTAIARRAAAMLKAYHTLHRVARSTEDDKKQQAILSSAETMYKKPLEAFQPRPWVIGFQNGTWTNGTFREARREDHLLQLAQVEYDSDADQGDWAAVLGRMTGGNADLALTLQDVAGYALSGASSLRLLLWMSGKPGTGKSTFSELLSTVLGDMATTVDPSHLAGDSSRERLGAAIWAKRVVLCAEAGNARLDAELLKTLSGADRLPGRLLYNEAFTFTPTHVLMMVANDPPRVEAYDDALKDRVLALPFTHRLDKGDLLLNGRPIEALRRDPNSALVRGFTAWAVEGLTRLHQVGARDIHRAAVCKEATQKFWHSVDELHGFWLSLDHAALLRGMGISDLKGCYQEWCNAMGTTPLGGQKFNRACESVGLKSGSDGKQRRWRLDRPAKFPEKADQQSGDELTGLTASNGFSQSSPDPFSSEREQERLSENSPEVVKPVSAPPSGWTGDDL
ncbi:phage/plasmid primase, P4 family [Deinococcus marmoris]|uniref:phage/plasmid primase, P4 family n=1 Tax=Deinococcus marmoris TaxID=249408 RepID=UPI000495621D|nr:phage/plasmid primase, P4 family [Deinococcus marmoris]